MGSQIWSARIDGTHVHQVTSGPGINENPDWAPSGNWIAFDHQTPPVGDVGGDDDIAKIRPNGTDRAVLTPTSIYFDGLPSWSPDSQRVAFQRTPNSNRDRIDIYSVAASGTGIKPLVATSSDEVTAAYSPTGTQVAYASPEIPASGNFDIWRSVIASGMRQRLTFNPGFDTQPDWQALP
jgi:Tol biopolymer transport system component